MKRTERHLEMMETREENKKEGKRRGPVCDNIAELLLSDCR